MKTADQIASELAPHISENNAAIGETDRRIVRLGDGQGNTRPATLLTPRDVLYHGDQGINDQGTAILSATCPIPIQQIDGYWDTEVWLAKQPGSEQLMITGLVDVGGFSTGGPTPSEALANNASIPSQDRLLIMRLRPADSGGLAVFVDVGVYAVAYEVGDGTLGFITSSNLSLPDPSDPVVYHPTASALASGEHRLIGVALDPVAGQLIAIPGAAATASESLPSRSEFVEADYQAIDFTGTYPAGYLYSYYGQTDFVEDDCLRLFDPRLFMKKMQVTASGTVTEVDTGAGLTGGPITSIGTLEIAGEAAALDNAILTKDSTQPGSNRWRPPLLVGAYNYEMTDSSSDYRIGLGFSSDGRLFSRFAEPAINIGTGWESDHVKDPCLVVDPLGVLWLFYSGYNGSIYQTGLARSYDFGRTWTKYSGNPIITATQSWESAGGSRGTYAPVVLYDASETDATKRWKMWYESGNPNSVGYAYSADGLSWTKFASNPVLSPTSGFESSQVYATAVVKISSTFYLFYGGYNGTTWKAAVVTFTNPVGTYTRSASNPLLSPDGISTTLTANVSLGDATVAVTDATIFPIGAPVWVADNSHQYLSYVTARPTTTSLTLADPAPVGIASASGIVRSEAYGQIGITAAIYDGGWRFYFDGFQPQLPANTSALRELLYTGYADADLAVVTLDYQAGLVIRPTLAETQGAGISLENLSVADLAQWSKRFDRADNSRVQVGGAQQTPRTNLNLIAGSNVTITPSDNAADDSLDVTIAASGGGGGGSMPPATCQGRLTLTTGVAVTTSDVTAATTLYFTPFRGNQVGTYSGSAWSVNSFTEKSLSLSGLTANTNYDIFIVDGTLALEAVAWSNDTTRATALVLQDGIYVKSGATTRRYLGTIRITGSTGQTEDSEASRFVWNYYNRVLRSMWEQDPATSGWVYSTNSYRYANGNSANVVKFVIGLIEDICDISYASPIIMNTVNGEAEISVGLDGTTPLNKMTGYGANKNSGSVAITPQVMWTGYLSSPGYHFFSALENAIGGVNVTFYSIFTSFGYNLQGGLQGKLWA